MKVHQIVNNYKASNTYLIEVGKKQIILIDPGGPEVHKITNWLSVYEKEITDVIVTHEHADHCVGLNPLYEHTRFNLYCSSTCARNMADSKQNLSKYNELEAFEVHIPSISVQDGQKLSIEEAEFTIYETPGHSPGSICIFLNGTVFTGDTILEGLRPPLNFPHSNRELYALSVQKLHKIIEPGMVINPGHGSPFIYDNIQEADGMKMGYPI